MHIESNECIRFKEFSIWFVALNTESRFLAHCCNLNVHDVDRVIGELGKDSVLFHTNEDCGLDQL